MNQAHLHIILVHFPVVLVPVATAVLVAGYWRSNDSVQRVALGLFMTAALMAIPAFLLGEGAERVVKHLPGISKHTIHEHEESAEVALWLTIVLGACSSLLLFVPPLFSRIRTVPLGLLSLVGFALVTSIFLGVAANKGGLIHHSEIQQTQTDSEAVPVSEKIEGINSFGAHLSRFAEENVARPTLLQ